MAAYVTKKTDSLLWIWLKERMKKVLGLRTPICNIRGVPVQGPLPHPQQCGSVRLTRKRASAQQTVKIKQMCQELYAQLFTLYIKDSKILIKHAVIHTICRL